MQSRQENDIHGGTSRRTEPQKEWQCNNAPTFSEACIYNPATTELSKVRSASPCKKYKGHLTSAMSDIMALRRAHTLWRGDSVNSTVTASGSRRHSTTYTHDVYPAGQIPKYTLCILATVIYCKSQKIVIEVECDIDRASEE